MQASTSWDDVAFSSTQGDRHLGIRPVSQLNTWPVVSLPMGDFHLLFFASLPGALRLGVIDGPRRGQGRCPVCPDEPTSLAWPATSENLHRSGQRTLRSRRHVCTSKAGPAAARTRVLRIHQVNRTKEKLD
jgi:hypothetical protein